ncbi:MAG TPA: 30S ribosomal protein S27ae [Nanoarchaeota archaeon]|nr:30S ribosomal protein S27ae [Candidatus Pacearchaeota archaeon]HIH17878.1 30S ribosomal protein S27ae [Nanoarchaeota archaeon]HIH33766.1 30S ribosomal protein S27ae [Nanoarchaeota archaeon]HIH51275.1 30S ribosomal protein S27ae [Nanoarchaeota archaeon]HIH66479.1 30S ribosomal protein S27ae [Nanoarchaeota archaeon]
MGKKKKRKRRESKRYTRYKVEGGKVLRPRNCPRCGPGVFLAASKNRIHCGKCHYTEFISGTPTPVASAPAEKK